MTCSTSSAVTDFVGYSDDSQTAGAAILWPARWCGRRNVEIFLDRTPFTPKSGGQIGDTGTITTDTGTATVLDTTFALPNLRRHHAQGHRWHRARGTDGDGIHRCPAPRAIRRNHTATHLLHYALRHVLGDHVKQAGSMVGPDRLRFDFSHYDAVTPAQIKQIEDIANHETLGNMPTRIFETTKDEAEALGAIAFFGDKYGDIVRVLEAGSTIELCGGTHVRRLVTSGSIKVVSESSIGSNLRRIEAFSGEASVALLQRDESLISEVAQWSDASRRFRAGVQRKLDEVKGLQDEIKACDPSSLRASQLN